MHQGTAGTGHQARAMLAPFLHQARAMFTHARAALLLPANKPSCCRAGERKPSKPSASSAHTKARGMARAVTP